MCEEVGREGIEKQRQPTAKGTVQSVGPEVYDDPQNERAERSHQARRHKRGALQSKSEIFQRTFLTGDACEQHDRSSIERRRRHVG